MKKLLLATAISSITILSGCQSTGSEQTVLTGEQPTATLTNTVPASTPGEQPTATLTNAVPVSTPLGTPIAPPATPQATPIAFETPQLQPQATPQRDPNVLVAQLTANKITDATSPVVKAALANKIAEAGITDAQYNELATKAASPQDLEDDLTAIASFRSGVSSEITPTVTPQATPIAFGAQSTTVKDVQAELAQLNKNSRQPAPTTIQVNTWPATIQVSTWDELRSAVVTLGGNTDKIDNRPLSATILQGVKYYQDAGLDIEVAPAPAPLASEPELSSVSTVYVAPIHERDHDRNRASKQQHAEKKAKSKEKRTAAKSSKKETGVASSKEAHAAKKAKA